MRSSAVNRESHHWLGALDTRHIRCALVAAELHSFTRAAEALNLKQITVSAYVSQLERLCGTRLFDRSTRGVFPTAAGNLFLGSAKRLLTDLESLRKLTGEVGSGRAGTLGIGFAISLIAGNLRSALISFEKSQSEVALRCVESDRKRLVKKLRGSRLDLIILSGTESWPETGRLPLWSEQAYVALSASHPLAMKEQVQWSDLRGEIFVAPKATADDIQAMVQTRLARPGHLPIVEVTDLSRETILGVVSAGHGITIISAGSTGLRVDDVVYRELFDSSGPHVFNFSAYWREDNCNPALQTFIGFLRERYSRNSPSR